MNKIFYFKNRMWGFAFIILFHSFWFYKVNRIPSEIEALILLTIYLVFLLNGIGIKQVRIPSEASK